MKVLVLVVQGEDHGNMIGVWADTREGLAAAVAFMAEKYSSAERRLEQEDEWTPRVWREGGRWGDDYSLERETVTEN